MPIGPITSGARLRLIWSFDGQLAINVIGLQVIGPVTFGQALANTLGSGIKTQFATAGMNGLMAPTTELLNVGIRDLQASSQPEFLDTGAAVAGTGTGDPLPRQTALVITHRTAEASRSGRGRTYFGGYDELQNDANGEAIVTCRNVTANFWNAMGSVLNSSQLTPAVIQNEAPEKTITVVVNPGQPNEESRTVHYAARAAVVRPIIANEIRDGQWDTQRRRNNGRGAAGLTALRSGLRF